MSRPPGHRRGALLGLAMRPRLWPRFTRAVVRLATHEVRLHWKCWLGGHRATTVRRIALTAVEQIDALKTR